MTSSSPLAVVLIDDSADLRLLLRSALQKTDDFTVVDEAGDGRTGVDQVSRHQPGVVLLDISMPVMDGLQALTLVREACPTAIVVMLSGFNVAGLREQTLAQGAHGYLAKGDPVSQLVSDLRGIVHGAQAR